MLILLQEKLMRKIKMSNPIPIKQHFQLEATATVKWFLDKQASAAEEKFSIQSNGEQDDDLFYNPATRPACIFPMINGKRAFAALYDAILAAKHSIEIVCWAFQPSLYLKRDGTSLPLGELLAKKAAEGVKVKILCFSMPLKLQNIFGLFPGNKDFINIPNYIRASLLPEIISLNLVKTGSLAKKNLEWWEKHNSIKNLVFKTHSVSDVEFKKTNTDTSKYRKTYIDDVSTPQKGALKLTPAHHQKTVLIDFDSVLNKNNTTRHEADTPNQAQVIPSGFVLGHNFLDAYWDNDQHIYDGGIDEDSEEIARIGKNVEIPLQDISCKVYGGPLALLKKNFDELWSHVDKKHQPTEITEEIVNQLTNTLSEVPNKISIAEENITGYKLHAQILRTYRRRYIKDIARLYIHNIRNATQFIYTENQYFRWPVIVNALKETLKDRIAFAKSSQNSKALDNLKVYWFATTNSSDTGIGSGTANTDRMLESLGKRNQLPEVARNRDWEPFKDDEASKQKAIELAKEQKAWKRQDKRKREMTEEQLKNHNDKKQELERQQFELYQKQEEKIEIDGIECLKSIICTLIAEPKDGKKDDKEWPTPYQETYIHSKCTIINDVMAISGSANLNTRSMEVDTEIAMVTECEQYATDLRQQLWRLHAHSDTYPAASYQNKDTPLEDVFDDWTNMAKENVRNECNGKSPKGRIKWFFRTNPKISYLD